eukprot:gene5074-7080_t
MLEEAQDNMNCTLKECIKISPEGQESRIEIAYVRGSQISFVVLPDAFKKAPFFNRIKLWRQFRGHALYGAGSEFPLGNRGGRGPPTGPQGRGGGRGPPSGGRGGGPMVGGRSGGPPPFQGGNNFNPYNNNNNNVPPPQQYQQQQQQYGPPRGQPFNPPHFNNNNNQNSGRY